MHEPEEVVRQWIETVWNNGNLERLEDFQPASMLNNDAVMTLENTRHWHDRIRAAFPDLYYEIEDLLFVQDKVVVRWRADATHEGTLWGLIPPTRKRVSWHGIHIVRVENGKIVEVWSVADQAPMLQQMGVRLLPPET